MFLPVAAVFMNGTSIVLSHLLCSGSTGTEEPAMLSFYFLCFFCLFYVAHISYLTYVFYLSYVPYLTYVSWLSNLLLVLMPTSWAESDHNNLVKSCSPAIPFLFQAQKNRWSFRTSGGLSDYTSIYHLSDHSSMRIAIPGPRYPLGPVLIRHVEISLSALLAEGRITVWSTYGRLIFFKLFIYICSIAFPFRTSDSGSIYSTLTITHAKAHVIILLV